MISDNNAAKLKLILTLSVCSFICHLQGVGADPHFAMALPLDSKMAKEKAEESSFQHLDEEMSIRIGRTGPLSGKPPFIYPHQLLKNCWISEQNRFITCNLKTIQAPTAVATVHTDANLRMHQEGTALALKSHLELLWWLPFSGISVFPSLCVFVLTGCSLIAVPIWIPL